MIDRLRHDIQERLAQLLAEAEKLRAALAALDPRSSPTQPAKAPPAKAPPAASRRRSARPAPTSSPRPRPAAGATKTAVLRALAPGGAMTAGEVAAATGLGRATVSTTLSKLAKSGEVTKAQRGYNLPEPSTKTSAPAAGESGE